MNQSLEDKDRTIQEKDDEIAELRAKLHHYTDAISAQEVVLNELRDRAKKNHAEYMRELNEKNAVLAKLNDIYFALGKREADRLREETYECSR